MVTGSYLLSQLSGYPWVIKPDCLEVFANVLELKFVHGVNMEDLKSGLVEVASKTSSQPQYLDDEYEIFDKKVVVPVHGKLMNRCGWLDACSGMKSMAELSRVVKMASVDSRIDHIILDIDSPGGSVYGTPQFAKVVRDATKFKRVSAFVDNQMCSGALWVGTAADEVFCSNSLCEVGSIGVYAMHIDQSQADKQEGLKYSFIQAGKYKTVGNPHEPLNDESIKEMQKHVDLIYKEFISAVSTHRDMSVEQVTKYAEGRVFAASELLDSGLIDGICTLDELLND